MKITFKHLFLGKIYIDCPGAMAEQVIEEAARRESEWNVGAYHLHPPGWARRQLYNLIYELKDAKLILKEKRGYKAAPELFRAFEQMGPAWPDWAIEVPVTVDNENPKFDWEKSVYYD